MRLIELDRPYSLQNDGELELLFLGVGTAFSDRLGHTNLLVVKGEDHVLIDLGTLGPSRLQSVAGLSALDITTFLPTHQHADHIGGLEWLSIVNRYYAVLQSRAKKLRLVITEEFQEQLWRMTLRGGLGFNEEGMDGRDELFDLYFDVIRPVESIIDHHTLWHATVGEIALELFRTDHVRGKAGSDGSRFHSYGLLIDNRVFFSSDTTFDTELIERYSTRAEWFFHDTGVPGSALHTGLDELKRLPTELKKRMILVHYPEGAEELPVPEFAGWGQFGVRYILD